MERKFYFAIFNPVIYTQTVLFLHWLTNHLKRELNQVLETSLSTYSRYTITEEFFFLLLGATSFHGILAAFNQPWSDSRWFCAPTIPNNLSPPTISSETVNLEKLG